MRGTSCSAVRVWLCSVMGTVFSLPTSNSISSTACFGKERHSMRTSWARPRPPVTSVAATTATPPNPHVRGICMPISRPATSPTSRERIPGAALQASSGSPRSGQLRNRDFHKGHAKPPLATSLKGDFHERIILDLSQLWERKQVPEHWR